MHQGWTCVSGDFLLSYQGVLCALFQRLPPVRVCSDFCALGELQVLQAGAPGTRGAAVGLSFEC